MDSKEPLNLKDFAKHMTGHGKIADYQMCVLVLGQSVECMSELLARDVGPLVMMGYKHF